MTKEKETSIRMLDECVTRLANITECIALSIEYFTNFENSSTILESFVKWVTINGLTTKKTGSKQSEYSLSCRKFAILLAEYCMFRLGVIILSKNIDRYPRTLLSISEIQ